MSNIQCPICHPERSEGQTYRSTMLNNVLIVILSVAKDKLIATPFVYSQVHVYIPST